MRNDSFATQRELSQLHERIQEDFSLRLRTCADDELHHLKSSLSTDADRDAMLNAALTPSHNGSWLGPFSHNPLLRIPQGNEEKEGMLTRLLRRTELLESLRGILHDAMASKYSVEKPVVESICESLKEEETRRVGLRQARRQRQVKRQRRQQESSVPNTLAMATAPT